MPFRIPARSPTGRPTVIHPLAHQLYQYNLAAPFNTDHGALYEVFEPLFTKPLMVARGAGRVAGQMRMFNPQVWFKQQRGVVGIGGIQNGQLISQPLLDPSQFEGV